jgi:arginine decarboxylase
MENNDLVPKELFLTGGVGRHKAKLASFELALRKAGIAQFNLVSVSSIFPPGCKIIPKANGLRKLSPGQVVFMVKSQAETNEAHRLISASVGIARPTDPRHFGYLSEHHDFGKKEQEVADYAEDLAAGMLATTLGVTEFDPEEDWDNKRDLYKISDKLVKTRNITQTAVGRKGLWTTVVAAAVLIL